MRPPPWPRPTSHLNRAPRARWQPGQPVKRSRHGLRVGGRGVGPGPDSHRFPGPHWEVGSRTHTGVCDGPCLPDGPLQILSLRVLVSSTSCRTACCRPRSPQGQTAGCVESTPHLGWRPLISRLLLSNLTGTSICIPDCKTGFSFKWANLSRQICQ